MIDGINYIEWIGYLASIIVAISLTMTSVLRLRWFNLLGATLFTIYGFSINALPIALVNFLIVLLNLFFLFRIYTQKDYFNIIEINKEDKFLNYFFESHKSLISTEFPAFDFKLNNKNTIALIFRNMEVAGIFIGKEIKTSLLEIELDFAVPKYRDFKTGKYLYTHNTDFFKQKGIKELQVKKTSTLFNEYYKKMNFKDKQATDEAVFYKEIN